MPRPSPNLAALTAVANAAKAYLEANRAYRHANTCGPVKDDVLSLYTRMVRWREEMEKAVGKWKGKR